VIEAFCKNDADTVFGKFIEMMVFDALIGSMDRHAQTGECSSRQVCRSVSALHQFSIPRERYFGYCQRQR